MEVGVYILAGGKSKRMGVDKAQLKIGHKCLIEYVLDVARKMNDKPIIISSNKAHEKFATCIPDLSVDGGPAVGILTALSHSQYEQNIILSCDMPLVDLMMCGPDSYRDDVLVAKGINMNADIVCYGGDFLYPFPGMYSKRILSKWKGLLDQGENKLQRMIKSFAYKSLAIEDQELFLNVNTPEDLIKAENKLG